MEQQELFGAEEERDKALEQIVTKAGEYVPQALRQIRYLFQDRPEWEATGEDIRLLVEKVIGQPHHPNAWGAIIRMALKEGIISRTGEWRQMRTPKSHARQTPVYRVG